MFVSNCGNIGEKSAGAGVSSHRHTHLMSVCIQFAGSFYFFPIDEVLGFYIHVCKMFRILTSNELSLPSFPTAVFQLTKLIDL